MTGGHQEEGAVLIHTNDGSGASVGGLRGGLPAAGNALAAYLVGAGGRIAGLIVLNGLSDLIQGLQEAAGFHDLAGTGGLAGGQTVDTADLDGIHADLLGNLIDVLLDTEVDLAHTETTVGAAYGVVGVNAVSVGLNIVELIRAGGSKAGGLNDVYAVLGVGAAIPVEVVLNRQELTVALANCGLDLGVQTLTNIGVDKLFLTGVFHHNGTALAVHGQRNDDTFDGGTGLGAEAAAHIGGDDTHLVQRDIKGGRQRLTNRIRGLAGSPNSALTVWLVLGYCNVVLDGGMLNMGNMVLMLGDVVLVRMLLGILEGRIGIALTDDVMVGDVGMSLRVEDGNYFICMQLGMDEDGILGHTLHGVIDNGQGLVLDLDQLAGGLGDLRGLGCNGNNGLTAELNGIDCQEVFILQVQTAALGVVVAGDYIMYALQCLGGGNIDAQDLGMGIGALYALGIQHTGPFHIAHILGSAGNFLNAVYTRNTYANIFTHYLAPPFMRSAASSIASIILL